MADIVPFSRWIFTKHHIDNNTPSRRRGMDKETESNWRYQAGNFIQEIGQKLNVTQLCINTAIVYQHRYYMYHPIQNFPIHEVCPSCIFLAAKVEEQPRKLEHVAKTSHDCVHRERSETRNEEVSALMTQIVHIEGILLQTLGFVTTVEHPHTQIVSTCGMVKAPKELSHSSYLFATTSLLVTTMCLQYSAKEVACVCINMACKWSNFEIPASSEGKEWFVYVVSHLTADKLEAMTKEFCLAIDKFPNKLIKKKALIHRAPAAEAVAPVQPERQPSAKPDAPATSQAVSDGRSQPSTSAASRTTTGEPWSGGAVPNVGTSVQSASTAGSSGPCSSNAAPSAGANEHYVPAKKPVAEHQSTVRPYGEQARLPNPATGDANRPLPPPNQVSDAQLRRVRTDSCLGMTTLSPQEYKERKERERLEKERVERESKKLVGFIPKPGPSDKQGPGSNKPGPFGMQPSNSGKPGPSGALPSRPFEQQHGMNIFDQIKSDPNGIKQEKHDGAIKMETDLDFASKNAVVKSEKHSAFPGVKQEFDRGSTWKNVKQEPDAAAGYGVNKVETKPAKEVFDLDKILKPEHMYGGSDFRLPLDSQQFVSKMDVDIPNRPVEQRMLVDPDTKSQKRKSVNPYDARQTNNDLTGITKKNQPLEEPVPTEVPQPTNESSEASRHKHHKREREKSRHRNRESHHAPSLSCVPSEAGPSSDQPAIQPIKVKINSSSTSSGPSSKIRVIEASSNDLKMKIRSPVFESRVPTERPVETPGIKLKISVKGATGQVETIVPASSPQRDDSNGGSSSVKLHISKKDGKYVNRHHHHGSHHSSKQEDKEKHSRKRKASESSHRSHSDRSLNLDDSLGNGHQVTSGGDTTNVNNLGQWHRHPKFPNECMPPLPPCPPPSSN